MLLKYVKKNFLKYWNREINLSGGKETYFLYLYISLSPDEIAQLLRLSFMEKNIPYYGKN